MLVAVPGDVQQAKRALRRRLVARRRALTPAQAEGAARACTAHLLALPELRRAPRIALYAALPDELPTRPLFDALQEREVPCLLPRMKADGSLDFALAAGWDALQPGRYGVLEPSPAQEPVSPGPGDVVLVPGVAFDRAGFRLGRGAGVYDRTLEQLRGVRVIGLAFAFQVVDAVPHDSHDQPVDAIVTEEGWCTVERHDEG
jgi:5-formyltetrahydrofolate cyclo-ligase